MNEHQFRINRALNYIEDNLFEDLTLEMIAKKAAMSPFHFHRTFSAIVETTVAQYIRSRRLNEILRDLHDPKSRLIDLAIRCGFESQEAFTRAFKTQFGVTPGQYQKLKSGKPGVRRISESDVSQAMGGHIEKPEIVTKAGFRVIGLGKAISGADFQAVYSLWAEYSDQSAKYFYEPDADSVEVWCDSHPQIPSQSNSSICIASHVVDGDRSIPPGFIDLVIPPAAYAKFIHRGHISVRRTLLSQACNPNPPGKPPIRLGRSTPLKFPGQMQVPEHRLLRRPCF